MARQRDYAAEYQRRKQRAQAEGFRSEKERSKARRNQTSGTTKSTKSTKSGQKRDWSAVYQRRKAKARREGYSGYTEKRRALQRIASALSQFDAAFGDRAKYNRDRVEARLKELEDEEMDEVLDTPWREMRLIMTPGQPAGHNSLFFYH